MSDLDLQIRVEKIVESYLRDRKKSYSGQYLSVPNGNIDFDVELINKQFQRQSVMNQVIESYETIIREQVEDIQQKLDQQLVHIEQEISNVKMMVISNWNDVSHKSAITGQKTSNSFLEDINNDSFFEDKDKSKELTKRIKDLEDQLKRKMQQTDNLINIIMDNQYLNDQYRMQMKQQITMNQDPQQSGNLTASQPLIQKLYDSIMPKLTASNDALLEEKLKKFKLLVDEWNKKQREKDSLQWTIVNDCKNEVDEIKKLVEPLIKINTPRKQEEQQQVPLSKRISQMVFKSS